MHRTRFSSSTPSRYGALRKHKSLLIALALLTLNGFLFAANRVVEISNPYETVNWGRYEPYRGNFHTHTTQSDGRHSVPEVIDAYHSIGYSVLAITDHNYPRHAGSERITHPWQDFDRDPEELGMIDVPGSELSLGDHIISLFSEYNSQTRDVGARLTGVGEAGGIAYFAHPARYNREPQFYADHYAEHPHVIGQAIYNQGDRHSGHRELWDAVLSITMPERPVWGISEDDTHRQSHVGRNRVYMLMPELTHDAVRASLESGTFYSTYSTDADHTPPALTGVRVDEVRGTITLIADNYTDVRWMSMGEEVATGETIDLVDTLGIERYVRAEFQGEEGRTYTNPFGLTYFINRPPSVSAGPDQTAQVDTIITLDAEIQDNGIVARSGMMHMHWEQVSGPAIAAASGADSKELRIRFPEEGTYTLSITVDDGQYQAQDEVTITVTP